MSRPDFLKKWASSRVSIPAISDPDYALGFAAYLGSQPPTTDDHDYIMNLQDQRAVWLGEQMLNTVGHVWQSDVTYDDYAVVRSPVNGQLYRSLISSNIGNEPSVSGSKWALGVQPLSTDFLNTTRINVASAATVNLTSSAPNTRHINITGTTTITAFTVAVGQTYFVRFAGALTLTNNAGIVTQSGANIVTQAGDSCIMRATANNVVEVLCYASAVADQVLHVQDRKPAGTGGGTFTSGADRTRDLNTVIKNTITGASLSSNQITLPAGRYRVRAVAPAYGVGQCRAKLVNVAGPVDLLFGPNARANNDTGVYNEVVGEIVLASSTVIELRQRCTVTQATTGFGRDCSFGAEPEIYSDVFIERIPQ